jgi:alginate O-acetyltransferase complex protein AlgJ
MNSPASPRKSWADWLVIAIFGVLLWLPTVDFFTGIDLTRPANENRLPAPAPHLTHPILSGLQNYIAGSELYFNDHFGFRKRLIRWYHQWKTRLFHDEGAVTKGAFRGQNGWLFYAEQQAVEHYLGVAKFTPAQLRAWQKLLEQRRDWLAERGIEYLFVVPPDKHNVYSEELPAWLQNAAPTNRVTKLDQFEEYMSQHSTVQIVDLRRPLLAAKAIRPDYLQHDNHWNAFGAFIGCQQVINALTNKFPDLPPLRLEDFTWSNAPASGGDLARALGLSLPEPNYFDFTPHAPFLSPQITLITNLVLHWDAHNPYAFSAIVENPAPLQETAVVFHDSFFGFQLRPYFGGSFKRTFFVWEDREFNRRIINENHPKIVINEMLERYFNTLDPEELMAKDQLP